MTVPLTDAGRILLQRFLDAERDNALEAQDHRTGGFLRLASGDGAERATFLKLFGDGYADGSWRGHWMRITDAGRQAMAPPPQVGLAEMTVTSIGYTDAASGVKAHLAFGPAGRERYIVFTRGGIFLGETSICVRRTRTPLRAMVTLRYAADWAARHLIERNEADASPQVRTDVGEGFPA